MKKGRLSLMALGLGFLVSFLVHQGLWEEVRPVHSPLEPKETEQPVVDEKKTRVALKMIQDIPMIRKDNTPPKSRRSRKAIAKKVKVSQGLISQGRQMIGNQGEMIGGFPEVIARYRKTLGFSQYFRSINQIGGRFFIMDKCHKRLVAEINFHSGHLEQIGNLTNLSPRSREITGESGVSKYIELAECYYGPSTYSMVLLLPLNVDYFLVAGLEDSLKEEGLSNRDFVCFNGIYKKQGEDLILEIISGKLKNGQTRRMKVSFNLSELSKI
ncbi:MAG TPA: hypothetical protein EYP21_02390 [Syntrophaceae bacterium]|nr:hypothetical protein [Syntrophaceae bacterium]